MAASSDGWQSAVPSLQPRTHAIAFPLIVLYATSVLVSFVHIHTHTHTHTHTYRRICLKNFLIIDTEVH